MGARLLHLWKALGLVFSHWFSPETQRKRTNLWAENIQEYAVETQTLRGSRCRQGGYEVIQQLSALQEIRIGGTCASSADVHKFLQQIVSQ